MNDKTKHGRRNEVRPCFLRKRSETVAQLNENYMELWHLILEAMVFTRYINIFEIVFHEVELSACLS